MIHLGNNISRLRSFRRIPQKDIASKLLMTQQEYSKLEGKEVIDDDLLQKIADIIDFPVEFIKQLDNNNSAFSFNQQGGNTGNIFNQYGSEEAKKITDHYEKLLLEKESVIQEKNKTIQQKDEMIEFYKNSLKTKA